MLIVYCDRNLLWEFRGCLITFLTSEYMSFMTFMTFDFYVFYYIVLVYVTNPSMKIVSNIHYKTKGMCLLIWILLCLAGTEKGFPQTVSIKFEL